MMLGRRTTGPGWAFERVALLFVLAVMSGSVLGVIVSGTLVLASRSGGSSPGASTTAFVALIFGAAVGAVLAATAAVSALIGLVVFDHWGESSPLRRSLVAGLSAAIGVGVFSTLLIVSGTFETSASIIFIAGVISGLCAGFGLFGFEKWHRHRT